jgi:alpha,alpha-trehalose phosphorylase
VTGVQTCALPISRLGVDAQDDSFLDKPRWPAPEPVETAEGRHAPLLLDVHPMTLFRHQVSKQADLVLAMVFAGDDVDPDLKRRNFAYYEGVTTHDSSLSNCPFAILAARVGELEKAGDYFRRNVLVDLDDRHGNTAHGLHLAALAGSWIAAVYGFAGLAWRDGTPSFSPVLPPGWTGLAFQIRWQGRRMEVQVEPAATRYRLTEGPALDIRHDGAVITVPAGGLWIERAVGARRSAA